MAFKARISLPGYNALTDSDVNHYALFADQDNVLIKEFARGSVTLNAGQTQTIYHGLGYVPSFYIFFGMSYSSGVPTRLEVQNGWGSINAPYADNVNVYIPNQSGLNGRVFRYYIFYDDVL